MSIDKKERVLSPHVSIYKFHVLMTASIVHRISGVALTAGTLLISWWLMAAASGGEYFGCVNGFMGSIFGKVILLGWSWALFYHMLNGIRHLFWDVGMGFELETARRTAWFVWAGSVILTIAIWALAYGLK